MEDKLINYGGGLQDTAEESSTVSEQFIPVDGGFDILEDMDTVLFFRVNSFIHNISNEQMNF